MYVVNKHTKINLIGGHIQMGNKKLLALIIPIALIIFIPLFGFSDNTSQLNFNINIKNNVSYTNEVNQTNPLVAEEKLNVNLQQLDKTKIHINLKANQIENSSQLKVTGNGIILVENKSYPFSIDQENSQLIGHIVNGKTYYKGILQGNIKTKKSDDVITIGTVFSSDLKEQSANVIVGYMGQDVWLSFGDNSFISALPND